MKTLRISHKQLKAVVKKITKMKI